MSIGTLTLATLAAGLLFGVLDFVWIGYIANDLYMTTLKPIMVSPPRVLGIAIFYPLYVVGLMYFVVAPFSDEGIVRTALQGALLGAFAYSVYDLTNVATLEAFTWKIAIVDIAWGAFASASACAAGAAVMRMT